MTKADWLRSEIEKLEWENTELCDCPPDQNCWDCAQGRGIYTSIITRYKEELKVLESK